jgi:hypothetical protein
MGIWDCNGSNHHRDNCFVIKRKNRSLLWFLGQIAFLGLSFNQFINLIQRKPEISEVMMSENNSLTLGIMGVFWALSMVCMILGIWFSSEDRR